MFERAIFDPLPVWPSALWPSMSLSLLFAIVWLNGELSKSGRSIAERYPRPLLPILLVLVVFMIAFENASFVYFAYMFGLRFIVVLVLASIFGVVWRLAMAIIPHALYWAPILHVCLALMTLTMIGALDVPFVSEVNSQIWDFVETLRLPDLLNGWLKD